ncbi:MAG: AraC family transcriptional regulator [Lachnospiraceae bacterium]|jgi:AraC-like DNA-binding protein/mannose-6-phosphate isomerase-like protein (cupin superfamily)|nr:AraC family transcriptional regulator [Lachnospiraceae bacterium]
MVKKEDIYTTVAMTKSERYLHTPGSFARQNLLYVQEVGHLESLQPHKNVREKLDSFLILVVLEGKGILEICDKKIPVSKGDCAWIDCMDHYEHISDEKDAWKLAWVHFNGKSARAFYELFIKLNNLQSIFHVENIEEWFNIIKEIMTYQREKNILSELFCGEQLLHLLNKILKCVADSAKLENEQEKLIAAEVREFVNENYAERNILDLVSNEFESTFESIGVLFKGAYGISLEEYISRRRYNAAKELLRFTVKPMDRVAIESGIGDLILMQQLFIQNEGMGADEYRQKWAGWIRG